MEKFENLTLSQADEKANELKSNGYQETQTIENVPLGSCSGSIILNTIGKGKQAVKSPSISVITFERDNKQGETLKLMFTAVMLNVLHISTGKSYNDIAVKVTDELREAISKPDNYTKELLLESVAYTDSQKRQRSILKFDSISK